jgi:hypothetical protein
MVDIKTYGMSRCVINFLYSMGDMGYRRSSKTAGNDPHHVQSDKYTYHASYRYPYQNIGSYLFFSQYSLPMYDSGLLLFIRGYFCIGMYS